MGQPDTACAVVGVPIDLFVLGEIMGVKPQFEGEEPCMDDVTKKLREIDPAFGVAMHGDYNDCWHYVGIMASTENLDSKAKFTSLKGAKERVAKLRELLEPKGLWDDEEFGLYACCEDQE